MKTFKVCFLVLAGVQTEEIRADYFECGPGWVTFLRRPVLDEWYLRSFPPGTFVPGLEPSMIACVPSQGLLWVHEVL